MKPLKVRWSLIIHQFQSKACQPLSNIGIMKACQTAKLQLMQIKTPYSYGLTGEKMKKRFLSITDSTYRLLVCHVFTGYNICNKDHEDVAT